MKLDKMFALVFTKDVENDKAKNINKCSQERRPSPIKSDRQTYIDVRIALISYLRESYITSSSGTIILNGLPILQ